MTNKEEHLHKRDILTNSFNSFNVKTVKTVKIGGKDFWDTVDKSINAFTICSHGVVTAFTQPHGHYSSYHSNHWYYSSIFEPIQTKVFRSDVEYKPDDKYRYDTSSYLYIRPKQPKQPFDLNNINWDLVPNWATKIICGYFDEGDVFFNGGGRINDGLIYHVNGSHANCPHDPFNYFNYHYEIVNHPNKYLVIQRPSNNTITPKVKKP